MAKFNLHRAVNIQAAKPATPPAAKPVEAPPEPKAPVVQVELSRCQTCGSTERTAYHRVDEQEYAGLDNAGKAYTHIVRRYCQCKSCGQVRIDRSYENRTA